MDPLIGQLERVRGRAMRMLTLMRLASAVAIVVGVGIGLGFSDYALRLPGWLRFVILLVVVGWGVWSLAVRWMRWRGVGVSLPVLALRLERIYPWTAGKLASAVSFVVDPPGEGEPVARELAKDAAKEAEGLLTEVEVEGVLENVGLMRRAGVAVGALVVLLGLLVMTPGSVGLAVARWGAPFGDAAWPNRYDVESATGVAVAANDAPLTAGAEVLRGDHDSLRVWAVYRFVSEGGGRGVNTDWQRALMTRQPGEDGVGKYQRLVEPDREADRVELYFEAGDDRTEAQMVELIQPPRLARLTARVEPPAYAAGYEPMTRHDLLNPPRAAVTVDGREGSRVVLTAEVSGSYEGYNGKRMALDEWLGATLPGMVEGLGLGEGGGVEGVGLTYREMAGGEVTGGRDGFEIGFVLREPMRFRFRLRDEYAVAYDDQRAFGFDVRADRAPDVTIVEPAADVLMLSGAVVDVRAEARDDVAVSSLGIEGWIEGGSGDRERLAGGEGDGPSAVVGYSLELSRWDLEAGDAVLLVATALDNYELDGVAHGAVESSVRRIGIIGEEELVRQVRTELAEVRQRADRARLAQDRLFEEGAQTSLGDAAGRRELGEVSRRQRDLAERVAGLERTLEEIRGRVEQNRLKDGWVERTLEGSGRLAGDAAEAAREGADGLARGAAGEGRSEAARGEDRERGGEAQQRAADRLAELTDMLDQGRDAYELRERLADLDRKQEELSEETRAVLPQTLGRNLDQLSEGLREALAGLDERQGELSREAAGLAQRMRATASALSRQSDRPEDQATAEALRRAAETAAREALDEQMEKAAEEIEQNRLASAQQSQGGAQQTIQSMMEQMGRADEFREEILRRRLAELVDSIRRLRDQQSAQLERLLVAELLDGLDGPLLTLRQNTLAVSEEARTTGPETQEVAGLLEKAAGHQAGAVRALRSAERSKPNVEFAERDALASLEEALAAAEKLSEQSEQEERDRARQELVAAYRKVQAKQAGLANETAGFAAVAEGERDRRWRAEVRRAGDTQIEIRSELAVLGGKVGDSIVYQSVHSELDAWAGEASGRLGRSSADGVVVLRQRMIVTALDDLVAALQPERPDEQFATGEEGGGEGSGGSTPGEQPLIPDAAEVKMLRSRQMQIRDVTRLVDEQPGVFGGEAGAIVEDLAKQQMGLADTGTRLISALQQRQGGAPIPGPSGNGGGGGVEYGLVIGQGADGGAGAGPGGTGGGGNGTGEAAPTLDDLLNLPGLDEPAGDAAGGDEVSGEEPAVGTSDLFMAAVNDMKSAGDRLNGAGDAGIDTQRVQERVIRRLDQLIDQLENQNKQGGGSGGKPQEQDTGQEGNQGQQGQGQRSDGPANDSADRAGQRGSVRDGEREDRPLSESLAEWGNLPQRLRDQLLQGAEDRVSPIYRSLTERYYKRLAEQAP